MSTECRKIKIAYFLNYGTSYGGAANTTLQQAYLMKKNGCEVDVFVSDYLGNNIDKKYKKICMDMGIELKIAHFQICEHTEDIDVIDLVEHYEELRDIIYDLCPDIMHSMQINPVVELIARDLNIPHIMNIYQLDRDFFCLKYMDLFPYYHICDSNFFAERWQRYLHTKSVCIRTFAAGDKTREEVKNPNKIIFICVGLICSRKRQLEVIQAFEAALNYGVKGELYIYGSEQDEKYTCLCKAYVKEHGLDEKIYFKGFQTDKSEIYKNADVLICASILESYPNVISEALAYGLIIISTPVAGVPEVIIDGINGYLAKGYLVEDICEKIIEVQSVIETGMGEIVLQNAVKTFENTHTETIISQQLTDFYLYVVQENMHRSDVDVLSVKDRFDVWIQLFKEKKDEFSYPMIVQRRLWYIAHISSIVKEAYEKHKFFYIWGAGDLAKNALQIIEIFFPYIIISGIIDSYKTGTWKNIGLIRPENIIHSHNNVIFISSYKYQDEIIHQLKMAGREYGKDFFIMSNRYWTGIYNSEINGEIGYNV